MLIVYATDLHLEVPDGQINLKYYSEAKEKQELGFKISLGQKAIHMELKKPMFGK